MDQTVIQAVKITNSAQRQWLCEEILILKNFLSDKNHPSQLVCLVSEDEETRGR